MTPEVPPCGCSAPGAADPSSCYCSVEGLLEVIRRRYSLAVMGVVRARDRARYHEIEAALPKASSSTLAETLRALELARLVEREAGEAGAHHAYRLTRSGNRLLRRLRGLLAEVQAS